MESVDAILERSETLILADRWEEAEELLESAAGEHPKDPAVLLAVADLIVEFHPDDETALGEALAITTRVEAMAKKQGLDPEFIGEIRFIAARALAAMGDSTGAVAKFEEARELLPDDADVQVELAMSLFEALRFDEARKLLLELRQSAPKDGRVHHYLGLIDEREGKFDVAERSFKRARTLDAEEFAPPMQLTEKEFSDVAETALEGLPERIQKYIANVPVLVEDLPREEDLKGDPPLSPLSLGMFRGLAGKERSHFDPWSQMPSSIVLFQKNLERYSATREELVEEIETTILHEVGHYLGWDEGDLYERGLD